MNTKRIPERAGPRNPDGKCRWCQRPRDEWPENAKRRITFCSDECVKQHRIRTQPDYAAKLVLERDHGVCCQCGRDCVSVFDRLYQLLWRLVSEQEKETGRHRCVDHQTLWNNPSAPSHGCSHHHCLQSHLSRIECGLTPWPTLPQQYIAECVASGVPENRWKMKRRLWEMDHIVPVIEGGGDCGLENLRTLCWACHKTETAALAARRAADRKSRKAS